MKQKVIGLATPTLGITSMRWAQSLLQLAWPQNTGKLVMCVKDVVGNEIAECRNRIVAQALAFESEKAEISHLFWLDDDVIAPKTAVLQLLNHNVPIASGVYFTKSELGNALIYPGRGCGTTPFVPDAKIEAWGHGMGLCLISMEVYKKMLAELKLPKDKYEHYEFYKTTGYEDAEIEGQSLFLAGTEDLYFLNNASKLGYVSLVDCSRYAFGFHHDYKSDRGYPKEQWEQMLSGKPLSWPNGTTWD